MIEETYVSFETAKLLKEKGFPQNTFRCHYIIDGNINYKSFENRCGFGDYDIIAPTLEMAMKWLREIHNIHIVVYPYTDKKGHHFNFLFDTYAYGCWHELGIYITDSWNTYEQACEVAIKYCLRNLI